MSDLLQELTYRVAMMQRELERLETLESPLTKIGARVYSTSGSIVLTNNLLAAIPFTAARYDTDGLWTLGAATRLTCTRAGVYIISGHVEFAANATGIRQANLVLNGGTIYIARQSVSAVSGANTIMSISTIYQLAAGDYVELICYQNSGVALAINAAPNYAPELAMQRIP